MKLREIEGILDTQVVACEDKIDDIEFDAIAAADMMSEVLAYSKEHSVLLTGLITPQVVRTAQMMDLAAIVFVRGKMPQQETIDLAKDLGIPLFIAQELLYAACGKLFEKGIPSC